MIIGYVKYFQAVIVVLGRFMFLDFVYHVMFIKNATFQKLDLFLSSGKMMGHLCCWFP
jgi:hypothetical protein